MLAIGRGLMQEPKMMLIDEPSLGLAPIMVDEIFRIIERLKSEQRTIVLVEQNTARTYAIADNIYVMRAGKIVTMTTPKNVTLAALQRLYFTAPERA
jgi:branched-chain amino acid transport system ATP-binding protein